MELACHEFLKKLIFAALTAMESCADDEKVARADDDAGEILVRHLKR